MFSCPPLMMICPPKPLPGTTMPPMPFMPGPLFFYQFFLSKIDLALRAAAGLSPSARRCRASVAAFSVAASSD